MKIEVFVDLEQVLIPSWDDRWDVRTHPRVKSIIDNFAAGEISIFSFAIYNEKDKQIFVDEVQPYIETKFNVKIKEIITVEGLIKEIFPHMVLEVWEFIQVLGKQEAFIKFIKRRAKNSARINAILIDDMVEDSVFSTPNLHIDFFHAKL